MARMLIVIFGLSAAIAGAFRQPVSGSEATAIEASSQSQDFVCPGECLECCQAHATGFFGWFGKHTDERFKCILKDHSRLPPGCDDSKAQTEIRTYMFSTQYKVTCPFGDGLEGGEAKARRKQLPSQCSQRMDCCCANEDAPWLECLPTSVQADTLTRVSDKSGSEELFIREEQARKNPGSCVNPSLTPLEYQVHKQKLRVSAFSTHDKCCIRVGPQSKRVKTGTREKTQHMGRWIKKTRIPTYGTAKWTGCLEFEMLYRCSEDKGLTQSGSLYQRVPFGQCLGEKSDSGPALIDGYYGKICPRTHFSQNCVCKEEC